MITALQAKEDLSRCLQAGADDFISKPVNGVELRARVGSLLRIKRQHDALTEALQLRQDMAAMVVHDMRNPLASIFLACEILRAQNLPEHQYSKLQQIRIASKQLEALIDSLLLMAKLEAGQMTLDRTAVDLSAMVEAVIADFQPMAAQRQLKLLAKLPEPDQRCLQALDRNLFRRVLDNLLSNAIKFSPKEGIIQLQVTHLAHGACQVRVIDQGPGVSEDLRQRIFEKYEVGQLVATVQQTGLGLAFCKIAIEAHGGFITVTDNIPQGTVFTVEVGGELLRNEN